MNIYVLPYKRIFGAFKKGLNFDIVQYLCSKIVYKPWYFNVNN